MAEQAPFQNTLSPGDIKLRHLMHADPVPWTLARFMSFALTDPDVGYYTTTSPIGATRDFTTSPEISPLFGEIVGAWLVNAWERLGKPRDFLLAELGPGRGTLMVDILRVARMVPGFTSAMNLTLVEASPILKNTQQQALEGYTPQWSLSLQDALNKQIPLLLVANEFFDALPIHQYEKRDGIWKERALSCDAQDNLCWTHIDTNLVFSGEGIVETCTESEAYMEAIARHIERFGGAAFICDYGYLKGQGDTFQGVRAHTYASPLKHVGRTDLTVHVNFGALHGIARARVHAHLTTQGAFLEENFIHVRLQQLMRANPEKALALTQGVQRLTSHDHMGALFKVLTLFKETK